VRFASLEHFGLSAWRVSCVGVAAACACWLTTGLAVGDSLGEGKTVVLLLIAALVFYVVVTTPKRILQSERMSQAREALIMSAGVKALLEVTGSRPRTLILFRPRGTALRRAFREAARLALLGVSVSEAVDGEAQTLSSYSAASTLRSIAAKGSSDRGDDEARGLDSAAELDRETKLPVFMTACFFAPIMLLLYAVFSHSYGLGSLMELAALEFVLLDIAFYLSSPERGGR
jgi:hypothetical protein